MRCKITAFGAAWFPSAYCGHKTTAWEEPREEREGNNNGV